MNNDIFVMRNEHSYAAFCGYLSNLYTKAFLTEKIRKAPYEATLYVDDAMLRPRGQQKECAVDRIRFLESKFFPTKYGVNLKIVPYQQEEMNLVFDPKNVGMTNTLSQCWKITHTNSKNIVTCNLPPKKWVEKTNPNHAGGRYFTQQQIEEHITPDTYIDYDTEIEKVYKSLSQSTLHISYQGGTAWISLMMNIPTIIVHNNMLPMKRYQFKAKIYGQDVGTINWFDGKNLNWSLYHPFEQHVNLSELGSVT